MPIIPRSSYYDQDYRQSAALIRARKPYLVKNVLTGIGLLAFSISLYTYTIRVVSQDDFDDVEVPAAPEQTLRAGANTVINGPVVK